MDSYQLADLLNDEFEFPEVGLYDWLSVAKFVLATAAETHAGRWTAIYCAECGEHLGHVDGVVTPKLLCDDCWMVEPVQK